MSLYSSSLNNTSGLAFHTAITPVDETGSFHVSIAESPVKFGLVHKTIQDIAEASIHSISVRAVKPSEIDSGLIEGTDIMHPGDNPRGDMTLESRGALHLIKPGHFVYTFTISSKDADTTAVSKLFQRFSSEGSRHVFPGFGPGDEPSTFPLCILQPEFYDSSLSCVRSRAYLSEIARALPAPLAMGGAAAAAAGGASLSVSIARAIPAPRVMGGAAAAAAGGASSSVSIAMALPPPPFALRPSIASDPSFRGYVIDGDFIKRIEPDTPMEASQKRFRSLERSLRHRFLGDVYGDAVAEHLKLSYEDALIILSLYKRRYERSKTQLENVIIRPCHSLEQVHERSRVISWLDPERQRANGLLFGGPVRYGYGLMIADSEPHARAMEKVAKYGADRISDDIGKDLNHRLDRSLIDQDFNFAVAATNLEEGAQFQTAVNLGLKVIQKARMIRMFAEVLFAQRHATWERRKHLLSFASI